MSRWRSTHRGRHSPDKSSSKSVSAGKLIAKSKSPSLSSGGQSEQSQQEEEEEDVDAEEELSDNEAATAAESFRNLQISL